MCIGLRVVQFGWRVQIAQSIADGQIIIIRQVQMGQQASSEQALRAFTSRYIVERELPEINCKLLRSRLDSQTFLLKQTTFTSSEELQKLVTNLNNRKALKHDHYLSLEEFLVRSEATFCSTFYRVDSVFKRNDHNLRDQVQARLQEGSTFREKELWSILCSCVIAMAYLDRSNVTYSRINPQDIGLSEQGVVKIVDPELCGLIHQPSARYYYPPEYLMFHRQASSSVIFSLGMCIMELIFLEPLFDCYDYESYTFNQSSFNVKLSQLANLQDISPQLKDVLGRMLKINDRQRPSVQQLEKLLFQMADITFADESIRASKPALDCQVTVDPQPLPTPVLQEAATMVPEYQQLSEPIPDKVLVDLQNPDEAQEKAQGVLTDRSQNLLTSSNSLRFLTRKQQPIKLSCDASPKTYTFSGRGALLGLAGSKASHTAPQKQLLPIDNRINRHNNQNLFTDPKLLALARQDLRDIQLRKSLCNIDQHLVMPSVVETKQNQFKPQKSLLDATFQKAVICTSIVQEVKPQQHGLIYTTQIYNKGRYEGQKKDGLRHGFGTFYYKEGGRYTGQWKNNRMDGRGTLFYYNDKVAYEGDWRQDRLWGYGVLYNEQPKKLNRPFDYSNWDELDQHWLRYQGQFVDDNKCGPGKLHLTNNERFEGVFEDDSVNGEGKFYRLDGKLVRGIWKNNLLIKEL